MTTKRNRHPIYSQDRDGRDIVLVPLANHAQPAKLLKEDFERLTDCGLGTAWTFNDNGKGNAYVRTHAPGRNLITVARAIVEIGRGRRVHYRDGNRLNLRSDNLTTACGYAKGKALPAAPLC